MDAPRNLEKYTVKDIYKLPEGQRAELIDGDMYMMAPPKTGHQRLVSRLNQSIANYISSKNGTCEVFPAPFAVFLNKDNRNYVEPDISVICDKNKIEEDGCNGAPDWVIEIVSQGSRYMDYGIKVFKYRSAGVKEYWIVDEQKSRITVYDFAQDTMEEYSFSDTVKAGIFEDLEIHFS